MDEVADILPLLVVLGLAVFAINRIANFTGAQRLVYVLGLVVGGGLGALMAVQRAEPLPWSWGIGVGFGASAVMGEVVALVQNRLAAKKVPAPEDKG